MTSFRRMMAACGLAATLWSNAGPAEAQSAQFKGIAALSRELSARIAEPGLSVELDWFLPAPGLADLLGAWSTFGSEHTFQNGTPNTLNMVIYHVTLTNFARTLGAWCQAPPLKFDGRFAATLGRLCTWPAASAKDDATLQAFWLALMGFAAPREEYEAWRTFFLTSSYRDRPARETVPAMALALTLNPYFLLHR